ncbi:platelet glycoprotein Ib alpha chain [Centropristis striata]|uniref:platelet glycoprotein Ib alpha chain n=1 Tax=Centropristis striata TaxID=184440 RepID=UPI0027E0A0EC|nr:platelet glycoprotein Ib alpha chain [Centropristis striata]
MQLFVVLLVLVSSQGMAVMAWAGCTRDRDKDHRTRENCTVLGFSDVPPGFEPTTMVMLFPNNLFSSLSWSSFQIFTKIYEIDLTANKVPEVTPSVTPILPTLSVLRLGSNRLTSLPDLSFSACPALTELYLDNNAVDSLSDRTFSGLSKLEILDLSSNRIKVLPDLLLHPLPAIETLLLENNKIEVVPDNWFSEKEAVPYLFFSANPWTCSCSLGYLRRYLDEYEFNFYVRDGPSIKSNGESVICGSPQSYKDKPVLSLEESDLCPPATILRGDKIEPRIETVHTTPPNSAFPTTLTPIPTTTTTSPTPIPTTTTTSPTTTTTSPTHIPITTLPTPIPIPPTTPAFIPFYYYTFRATLAQPIVTAFPAARLSTKSPTTVTPSTPAVTTPTKVQSIPSTVTSATLTLRVSTTTEAAATSPPPWVIREVTDGRIDAAKGAAVFCFWLFVGCLLMCVASAACILVTVTRLVFWYRQVYKPLSMMLARRRGGGDRMALLACSRRERREVAGGGGGGGGAVMALYRSVLYIHKEGGVPSEREDGWKESDRGNDGLLVTLVPTGRGGVLKEEEGERVEREEKGVYRKTLYRLCSREQEVEGWRNVMEECQVSAGGGGAAGGGGEGAGGGGGRKSYSVILREEREEAGGGREELEWVVGGWEVKSGSEEKGAESRSSWGEWLAHYLPSMPWGVATPPDGGAAQ